MEKKFEGKNLLNLDLFGKEAELYYKGKSKRSSFIGILFTLIYLCTYIGALLYIFIRLQKKTNIIVYDSYDFKGKPPSITLNQNIFYGGFALGNHSSNQTFVDNSIYSVKANYKRGSKINNVWTWETIPLDLEICELEKFGEKYRDIFKDKSIYQLYCISNINHTLQGHSTDDVYSYFHISFFPCMNDSENNDYHCQPQEIFDNYLTRTFVTFKMEDIDLTPQLYYSPVYLRGREVKTNLLPNLYQDIYYYFKVINIETDKDILGFDFFEETKKEKYLKYEQSVVLNSLMDERIVEEKKAICNIMIALSEKELTQRRTYKKLIELLGDLGGVMEVLLSIFRIVTIIITGTLYELSLINNLFFFDLDRRQIIIKEKYDSKIKNEDNSPKAINCIFLNNEKKKNYLLCNNDLVENKIIVEDKSPKKIVKKKKIKIKSKILVSSKKPSNSTKKIEEKGIESKASNIENS